MIAAPKVAALLLAAGASTRMGHPKALLVRGGETALARTARIAREAGCDPVVVVLGHHAKRVRTGAGALGAVTHVENPAPDSGRTGSAKCGLAAAPGADAYLVWPVDHPAVDVTTVRALVQRFQRERAAVLVPVHGRARGHPVLLRADVAREVAALADDAPLRDVVIGDPTRVREVRVDDEGVLLNLDTPEDAARAGWSLPG